MINCFDTFLTSICSNIFNGFNGFYGVLVTFHRFIHPPYPIQLPFELEKNSNCFRAEPRFKNILTQIHPKLKISRQKNHKFCYNFIIRRFPQRPISIEWNIYLIFVCCWFFFMFFCLMLPHIQCYTYNHITLSPFLNVARFFHSFCQTIALCRRRIERYQITTRKQEETEEKINYL